MGRICVMGGYDTRMSRDGGCSMDYPWDLCEEMRGVQHRVTVWCGGRRDEGGGGETEI